MLRSADDLIDYGLHATDGPIGHVTDFYFDDEQWVIRYLVVDTGSWASSRKVLISPTAIVSPVGVQAQLLVSLTKEQVKNSPDIDTAKPISRAHEAAFHAHHGYERYWESSEISTDTVRMSEATADHEAHSADPLRSHSDDEEEQARDETTRQKEENSRLRSFKALMRYQIHATDGDMGHVRDLLFDEKTWAIRYLAVNTSGWWVGHEALIAPQWIKRILTEDAIVQIDLTRQAVQDAPPYDSAMGVNRDLETLLFRHYGRKSYWTDDAAQPHSAFIP